MAETDKRDLILVRLQTLFASIDGVKRCDRNNLDMPEKDRPCVVILDADEGVEEQANEDRGRPPGLSHKSPFVVTMTPEIYILAGAKPENVGSILNALRIKLIKAVLGDETLLSLAKDGDIKYLGFATGLAAGRSMEGEAGISFQFRYMIHPSKL